VEKTKEDFKTLFPYIPFSVKIHATKSDWLAQYRSGSLIRGGRAIIWISDKFFDEVYDLESQYTNEESDIVCALRQHLRDTIGHELIHAIQEAIHFETKHELISAQFDEQEAETLGLRLAKGTSITETPLIQKFMSLCK
jgi:hypothetical protein